LIYLGLLGVLAAGLWLRLRFIHTVRLYPDEFVTLLAVQMIGQKGLPVMPSGLFYEHGLLFSYVGSLAALLGPGQLAVRYASLLLGMLTLGLTFWVGRRWFSPAAGLMAATALAIAPAAIHWSGRARMYTLLQLLVLLTLWLAYEGVSRNRTRWRWAALLAYGGALLTQFAAVALAPSLVLALAVVAWFQLPEDRRSPKGALSTLFNPRRWEIWLEMIAFAGILAVAFWVKRLGQPKGIEALAAENTLTGLVQVFAIYSDFSFNVIAGWLAISPFYLTLPALFFACFALFAVIGEWLETRNTHADPTAIAVLPCSPATLYLTLILLTTTVEMIFIVSPDRRDDKYMFMLLPVLLLLGARGMVVAGRLLLRFVPAPAAALLSLISPLLVCGFILMAARAGVQLLLSNLGDDYETAFAFVQNHRQPGDTVLTGTPPAAALYLGQNDFYSVQRRGGYDYRILTVNSQPVDRWLGSPAITNTTTLHHTLAHNNVWLVLERWGVQREYYDLPFQQQLLAQTDYAGEAQGIFILRSKPNPQPVLLNPTHPADAILGDMVRLTGYTIEPENPAPGQAVRLTLYWQPLAPMPHDYTVFIHLRKKDGGNVAQADHRPLGSVYPTSLWPVGETIRETSDGLGGSTLMVPSDLPPGDYELWVGMYLLETGERLPVQNDTSGENAVRLGTFTVKE
jgi:4-amino-4-deoxy-L-arabinose transferase-like glycosyltransferase